MTTDPLPPAKPCRLPEDSTKRKEMPMCEGLIDYFPDALAYVSGISFRGNQKHNPGEELHHSRGKSGDHANCIARHLVDRGKFDAEGVLHDGYLAWRSLANLQETLEKMYNLPLPRGARFDAPVIQPAVITQAGPGVWTKKAGVV